MGCITMTKGMKRDFFFNIGFFQSLPHYPTKAFAAISAIGVPAVKKPDVRFFYSEICLKSFGHILRERNNTIFLVFALTDMNSLSLIHISEPTRRTPISYAVFCLKKKN